MRQEDVVIVIPESSLESHGVVKAAALLLHAVLVVAYVLAVPHPAHASVHGRSFARIYQRLHALIVGTLRLNQVYDVKLVRSVLLSVAYFKVKPLCICTCTMIILQYQIVFIIAYLNSSPQIS